MRSCALLLVVLFCRRLPRKRRSTSHVFRLTPRAQRSPRSDEWVLFSFTLLGGLRVRQIPLPLEGRDLVAPSVAGAASLRPYVLIAPSREANPVAFSVLQEHAEEAVGSRSCRALRWGIRRGVILSRPPSRAQQACAPTFFSRPSRFRVRQPHGVGTRRGSRLHRDRGFESGGETARLERAWDQAFLKNSSWWPLPLAVGMRGAP
jgi:hypothetical protein